jgi:hypothetical protein
MVEIEMREFYSLIIVGRKTGSELKATLLLKNMSYNIVRTLSSILEMGS